MTNIKIIVATHKKYQMPDENMYLPVQSGAAINDTDLGYQRDDTGDNISKKNKNFSELTAMYWAWKNLNSDYKGLVHYRRYFSKKKHVSIFTLGRFEDVLDEKKVKNLLKKSDIVLPNLRKYYVETIESHYQHTHHAEDLIITKNVLEKMFPTYVETYQQILKKRSAHMFNMLIMRSDIFDEYCEWLFSILFEVENELDISNYDPFNARVFGRISEILLDVWIQKNHLTYVEAPVMFMEKQNWVKKITKFFKAKTLGEKY